MRKLVLHIGGPKTGSSSLQSIFKANRRNVLLKNQYWYPRAFGPQHRLVNLCFCPNINSYVVRKKNKNRPLSMQLNLNSTKAALALKEKTLSSFKAELDEYKNHNFLVSSEALLGVDITTILEIKKFFARYFDEVQIIGYVRSPVSMAVSAWSQAVKGGSTQTTLPKPVSLKSAYYRKHLSRWSDVFGSRSMSIRIFHKTCFTDGDLYADFFELLDIDVSSLKIPLKRVNPALSGAATVLLAEINKLLPKFVDNQKSMIRKGVVLTLLNEMSDLPRYNISAQEKEIYVKHFSESDEWLRAKFFPEREIMWPQDSLSQTDSEALSQFDFKLMARLFVSAWLHEPYKD